MGLRNHDALGRMTVSQFAAALVAANIKSSTRTAAACRLVLVDGATAYAASQQVGISRAAVSKALARLARPVCPTCGQAIR
jgi:hypothetical protein